MPDGPGVEFEVFGGLFGHEFELVVFRNNRLGVCVDVYGRVARCGGNGCNNSKEFSFV
jgi:hypothetical protein